MAKIIQPNGSWTYQIKGVAPNPAPPITDSTPPPVPLSPSVSSNVNGYVSPNGTANPVIPSLEVSLTNLNGVNFQSTGSDTKMAPPVSAQGSGVILVPNSSVSFRNPS